MSTAPLQDNLQAQVLYEYEANDEDQLSIKPGEIIIILDNGSDLNGWALAQKGDKEGYVPAQYVRYINRGQYEAGGFENLYNKFLIQEHHLPFFSKLKQAIREVLVPFPCSRYGYIMTRKELRTGAIFLLLRNFVIAVVDALSLLAPIIFTDNNVPTIAQFSIVIANIFFRILLTLLSIRRYPRPNLVFCTFPFVNVIAALTYSIRYYEFLEIGECKEYDGYRYHRTWMYCFLLNTLFEIASLVLIIIGTHGTMIISILVVTWNILNFGRCFLGQWSNVEKGNDVNDDFEKTIEKYHL